MANLDFPTSPSPNDTYSAGGRTWKWNGEVWEAVTPLPYATETSNGVVELATPAEVVAGTNSSLVVTPEGDKTALDYFTGTANVTILGTNANVGSSTLKANNGILFTADGLFVDGANGTIVDASGVNVLPNNGIIANTTGVWVDGANGITVDASGVNVEAGQALVANTTGVHLANTAATAGSFGDANTVGTFTVDQQGRLTASGSADIDHDTLLNYVTDEHVAHTGVTLTAANGLTGGGDISTSRQFDVLEGDGIIANTSGTHVDGANGITVTVDGVNVDAGQALVANTTGVHLANTAVTTGAFGDANTVGTFTVDQQGRLTASGSADIDHDTLLNFVANEHIDHSGVSINSGNGLTGGGAITTTQSLSVLANNGIIANSTGTWVDGANGISVDASGVNVLAGQALVSNTTGVHLANTAVTTGSYGDANTVSTFTVDQQGRLTAAGTADINHDTLLNFVSGEHVLHTGVTLTAANGLTGGGDISASRQFDVVAGTGVTVNTTGVHIGQDVSTTADVTFGSITVSGDMDVSGNVTFHDTDTLQVNDSLISLAFNNGADTLDIGMYGQYNNGTERFSGLFRDASDGKWKLYANSITEPTSTVDTGATGHTQGTLVATYEGTWAGSTITSAYLPAASNTAAGIIETATEAETDAGTNANVAVSPAALAAWNGSSALVTVGTLSSGDATGVVSAASNTVAGKVEMATGAEANTGTDPARAISPASLAHWNGTANVTIVGTLASGDATGIVSAASNTVAGKVEMATGTETNTGTDPARAVSPAAIAAFTGQANIVTVGTLSSGDATSIVSAASNTAAGKVEMATGAEAITGTDPDRAVSPAALAAWTGTSNVTTLGSLTTLDVTGNTELGNTVISDAYATTTAVTADQVIDDFDLATYRSAEILLQAANNTTFHLLKALIVHDDTNVNLVQYGEVIDGSSLFVANSAINGSNVEITVTPSSSSTINYRIHKTLVKV